MEIRNGATEQPTIRHLLPGDSIAELTALLHRAYAPLAARGMRFVATWQDEEITRQRIRGGTCLVAVAEGALVGTITLKRPAHSGGCPWLRREDVVLVCQFAVEPALQGRGVGLALLAAAEARARDQGYAEVALDTAETAAHLIAFYTRRGYRLVGTADWEQTNYASVVMSKTVGSPRGP